MKTRIDQTEKRQVQILRDQHDRPWDCILDVEPKAKLAFCAPPIPKFSAPIMPPQAYIRPDKENALRVRIDYDGWIAELRMASEVYTKQLRTYATQQYKGSMIGEVLRNPPADLVAMVGIEPPPLDFARAARVGNPWVLGLRKRNGDPYDMPEWAKPIAHILAPKREESLDEDRLRYLEAGDEEAVASLGFDTPELRADAAKYLDLEESADPDASGGRTDPVRRGRRATAGA